MQRFQGPSVGPDSDLGKFKKLAQRVEETLTTEIMYAEPKQLDPVKVLVSPLNRLGASPNVRHVHMGILKSFLENSYDRTRPAVGICIEYKSEKGIKEVLEHNRRFCLGNKLLPPITENMSSPIYGSLACTHLNLAFRCIKTCTPSPLGPLDSLLDNGTLKEVVMNGHKWWVLPETLSKERQIDISLWRNQDQNENQAVHELEILQTIKFAAEGFLKAGKAKVSLGDLVSAAQKRNPAKISPSAWMTLSKYYIGFLENQAVDLIEDLNDFHSNSVDPRDLCVSIAFFSNLESEQAMKQCPQVRHFLLCSQYCTDKVKAQAAGPSVSQFLEASQIVAFCKKPDQVLQLEKTFRDLKAKYIPILEQHLGARVAKLEITAFFDLIIRSLFCRAWPPMEPRVALPVGKFSEEKIQSLAVHWAKVVDTKHPTVHFANLANLEDKVAEDPSNKQEVKLEGLRSLKGRLSDGPEPVACLFKRGDKVTVIRRMTWFLPQKGHPLYKKDLPEGTEGVVEGYADPEHRQVLLKVVLKIKQHDQEHTQVVTPRNLKLTSDYLLTKAGSGHAEPKTLAAPDPSDAPSPMSDKHKALLPKLLMDSAPANIQVEDKWKNLLADGDELSKMMYLRGRIATGLQSLLDLMPKYSEKDLLVVNRKTEKGIWKSELWTNRSFEPLELQLAPASSQIKETNLMASAHAIVTLPKHGRGAHPTNMSLALDGRTRTRIATKGMCDDPDDDHWGSLYWLVTRTEEAKLANLEQDMVTWQQQIKVTLPAPKRRKTEVLEWEASELPAFPILVNKKALAKHTLLQVFHNKKDKIDHHHKQDLKAKK